MEGPCLSSCVASHHPSWGTQEGWAAEGPSSFRWHETLLVTSLHLKNPSQHMKGSHSFCGSQKPTKNERPWQRRKPSFWERGLSPRLEVQGSFCFPLIVLFQQVPEQQDGQVKSHCPCHLSQKGGTGLEVKNPATHRLILSNTTRLKWNRFLATLLPVTPSSLIPSLTCHAPLDSLRNRTKKRFFLPPSLHQWLN